MDLVTDGRKTLGIASTDAGFGGSYIAISYISLTL
jgi:hypothetical protein